MTTYSTVKPDMTSPATSDRNLPKFEKTADNAASDERIVNVLSCQRIEGKVHFHNSVVLQVHDRPYRDHLRNRLVLVSKITARLNSISRRIHRHYAKKDGEGKVGCNFSWQTAKFYCISNRQDHLTNWRRLRWQ